MRRSRPERQAKSAYPLIAIAVSVSNFVVAGSLRTQDLHVEALKTEYQQNPIAIDVRAPRLSWRIQTARRSTMQSAYKLRVATDSASLQRSPFWDSGRLQSSASILRPYAGPTLHSGARDYWQVRVWDDAGQVSPWSVPRQVPITATSRSVHLSEAADPSK